MKVRILQSVLLVGLPVLGWSFGTAMVDGNCSKDEAALVVFGSVAASGIYFCVSEFERRL
jgi:hypothetical protein